MAAWIWIFRWTLLTSYGTVREEHNVGNVAPRSRRKRTANSLILALRESFPSAQEAFDALVEQHMKYISRLALALYFSSHHSRHTRILLLWHTELVGYTMSVSASDHDLEEAGEHHDNEKPLPPVDGGKDAWLFLFAIFVLEAVIWGL